MHFLQIPEHGEKSVGFSLVPYMVSQNFSINFQVSKVMETAEEDLLFYLIHALDITRFVVLCSSDVTGKNPGNAHRHALVGKGKELEEHRFW
uniref:Uncharacterized protein n=1 Tax=Leersia perrieri TaxID=77586 RepID=A0A0D9WQ54_9ORYZ